MNWCFFALSPIIDKNIRSMDEKEYYGGKTALQIARKEGYKPVVEIIERAQRKIPGTNVKVAKMGSPAICVVLGDEEGR
jgi:hypothetical protein